MWEIFGNWALWSTAIGDLIFGSIALYSATNDLLPVKHKWFKWTVITMGVGLIGQTYRSWYGIVTGVAPMDSEMPFWIFKDYGEWMMIAFFIYIGYKKLTITIK